ncbi:MAG: hypothetical protein ACSHW0_09020 [Thalassotalea sp.]
MLSALIKNSVKGYDFIKPLVILVAFLLSSAVSAIQLDHLVTFNKVEDTQFNWQQVLAHPSKQNDFYVFTTQGKILEVVNGKLASTALLDVAKELNNPKLSLTAMALHPNFALKDLPGHHIFYTAHVESFNDKRRLVRLPKVANEANEFDLVVYEWHIDILGKNVDVENKREIIRIASPEKTTQIKQLTFNPYLKPWQDEFGSLFIILNQSEKHQETPLYSGVVLRINPDKFGLRNYTIPETNPFNSNAEIDNEIIALGAKNIHKVLWQKKNNQQWFSIVEQAPSKEQPDHTRILTVLSVGDDLRKEVSKPLWQGASLAKAHQIAWYEGRRLANLLYKLITVEYANGEWQLHSLSVAEDKTVDKILLATIPNIDPQAQLGLTINNQFELMLLNITDGVFSQIKAMDITGDADNSGDDSDYLSPYQENDYSQIYLWLAVFSVFIIAIFVALKIKNHDKEKSFVRKHYNRFELSNYSESVDLFKRHQKTADVSLSLSDIAASRILLNHKVINIIDEQPENRFSDEDKAQMNHIIALEQRLKMVDHRARVIAIEIIDKSGHVYTLCLYARRGNQRYTRIHYQECLNMINSWCVTISETINAQDPKVTETS